MTDTTKLLSQLAYAKHRGCTHGAVRKAILSGRLKKALVTDAAGKVSIDPVIADSEWQSNTSPAMQRGAAAPTPAAKTPAKPAKSGNTRTTPVSPDAAKPIKLDALGVMMTGADEGSGESVSMADARALKEHYLALLAQLDYNVKSGVLIEANAARQAGFAMARTARDKLLTIADRLAPVVAGVTDQFECHRLITEEIRKAISGLNKNPLDALVPEAADAGR